MSIPLCIVRSTYVPLCEPPPMSPRISCWIQFFKVTTIVVSYILSSWPCLAKNAFLKESCFSVSLRILLVSVRWWVVVISCLMWLPSTVAAITRLSGNVTIWYHSVRALMYYISCTQILSDIEVMVLVCKNSLERNPHLFDRSIFPPLLAWINLNSRFWYRLMVLLDDLWCRVNCLAVIGELYSVIDALEVFIDWQGGVGHLIHSLIVRFDIRGFYIPISIEKILKKIAARDSKKYGALVLQILQVSVFGGVYDLVIEGFMHSSRIIVDFLSLIMLKLN